MTKSRKLILASILLAGGYGLALVLSGLTDYLDPNGPTSGGAPSDRDGLLATLKELVPHHADSPEGRLVPESAYVASQGPQSNVESQRWNDRPTWLAATPPVNAESASTSPTTFAAMPTRSDSRPPEPAPLTPIDSADEMPRPVARITNVVGSSSDAAARSASPWDRWPRWEPGALQSPGGAVATSYQGLEPVAPRTGDESSGADGRPTIRHPEERAGDGESQGRTHVVIDGDSLSKLADRYLDDPGLEDEIFRLNRDVLTDPAMLPIGVELRIPDRRMPDSASLPPRATRVVVAPPDLPAPMVPVERMQKSFAREPRAKLLGPIATGRSD